MCTPRVTRVVNKIAWNDVPMMYKCFLKIILTMFEISLDTQTLAGFVHIISFVLLRNQLWTVCHIDAIWRQKAHINISLMW